MNKHSNNCLSGQYVTDGADLTGNYGSDGYIDFSIAKFGACHRSEKDNLTTSETIAISAVTDKYRGNDTVSLRGKTDSYNSAMSGFWRTFVNGLSSIAIENSISFAPTVANIRFEKAGKLPGVSWELSQKGTSLVDGDHGYPMAEKFNSRNLR